MVFNMLVKGLLGFVISMITILGCRKLGADWFEALMVATTAVFIFNIVWDMHHRNKEDE